MFRKVAWILALAALVAGGLAWWRVGSPPRIKVEPELPAIGKRTPIRITVEESRRGLSGVRVEFVQGERTEVLVEKEYALRPFWAFWGPKTERDEVMVEVGRETVPGLRPGEATLRVTAGRAGTWLRKPPPAVRELTLPVRLTPPSLEILSDLHYVTQGGCDVVVYRVGETSVADGVQVGEWWFPGYPLPGGGGRERFALFAVPHDLDDVSGVRLVAADEVGNEAALSFIQRFFPRPLKATTIELTEKFMAKVVPEILSRTPELQDRGSLLDNYLAVNGELRKQNNAALRELAATTRPAFLWREPFLQMPNAKVMSAFADRRTYRFRGQVVDRQDHLGFDLASTRRVPVPAANSGVVALARYLGIYGNTVVLDHGYGLMSLYGHLSSIEVGEGQIVERGQTIGRTGETGLAGGDHLHFTLLLHGLPVNPLEWWDGRWIRDRIARKLGRAFPS